MDNQTDEDSESSGDESEAVSNGVGPATHTPTRARSIRRAPSKTEKQKKQGFWDGMLTRLFDSTIMQSIEGRAAMVHNFMRGLSLNNMYPFSPFTQMEEDEPDSSSSSASKNGERGEGEDSWWGRGRGEGRGGGEGWGAAMVLNFMRRLSLNNMCEMDSVFFLSLSL